MLPSLMTYPAEVRDGLHFYETPRLWVIATVSSTSKSSIADFTGGAKGPYFRMLRENLSRQFTAALPHTTFFNNSQEAVAWCKQFIRDWMQCEEEYQEDAYRALAVTFPISVDFATRARDFSYIGRQKVGLVE
jgi:hypothetical protein